MALSKAEITTIENRIKAGESQSAACRTNRVRKAYARHLEKLKNPIIPPLPANTPLIDPLEPVSSSLTDEEALKLTFREVLNIARTRAVTDNFWGKILADMTVKRLVSLETKEKGKKQFTPQDYVKMLSAHEEGEMEMESWEEHEKKEKEKKEETNGEPTTETVSSLGTVLETGIHTVSE